MELFDFSDEDELDEGKNPVSSPCASKPSTAAPNTGASSVSIGSKRRRRKRESQRKSYSSYKVFESSSEDDDIFLSRKPCSSKPDQLDSDSKTNNSSEGEATEETEEEEDFTMRLNEEKIEWPKLEGVQADEKDAESLDLGDGVEVPASVNRFLRQYQREGIKWIYKRIRENCGCLLNDDMGLGKTVQIVALLTAIYGKTGKRLDSSSLRRKQLLRLSSSSSSSSTCTSHSSLVCGETHDKQEKHAAWTSLILCPAAVIHQWEQELHKWGCFAVNNLASCAQKERRAFIQEARQGVCEILLSTYEMFKCHADELCEIPWECCIMDEVHKLKNPKSKTHQAVTKLKTLRRIGLTGTAMQNVLRELFVITCLVRPNWLGDRSTFKTMYENPIHAGLEAKNKDNARVQEKAKKRGKMLRKLLRKVILRRDKGLVRNELPEKKDRVVFVKMTSIQTKAYQRILNLPEAVALRTKDDPCDCGLAKMTKGKCCHRTIPDGLLWRYYHFGSPEGCTRCPTCLQLPLMTLLSKVANHPRLLTTLAKDAPIKQGRRKWRESSSDRHLFEEEGWEFDGEEEDGKDVDSWDDASEDDEENEEGVGKLAMHGQGTDAKEALKRSLIKEIMGEDVNCVYGSHFEDVSDRQCSGKLVVLAELLKEWTKRSNVKVLVFSQYTRMLGVLEAFLKRQAVRYARYDGSMSNLKRREAIESFCSNETISVLLISTRAGGVGLNLTVANKVVILDPMWNVALDSQAQDRAFRLGQRQDVTIFRFFAKYTMEELVFHRQNLKQQLSSTVETNVRDPKQPRFRYSTDALNYEQIVGIKNMLTWKGPEQELDAAGQLEGSYTEVIPLSQDSIASTVVGQNDGSHEVDGEDGVSHSPVWNRDDVAEARAIKRTGNLVLSQHALEEMEYSQASQCSQEVHEIEREIECNDVKTVAEKCLERRRPLNSSSSSSTSSTSAAVLGPSVATFERRYKRKRRFVAPSD